eukprot:TRINITY_DN3410_c0_g1_i1.p1 TRINITY_DN3410_c0_g1~~TRINITY_DN3410_c0_g1_i1.p1  ORF type:complete len:230 (-),score=54.45 TRINITY_DN3410_c0_g1_i1:32-721(-)
MAFDNVPNDILSVVFSFVPFKGQDWLNVKLVNKKWKQMGDRLFDPNACDALRKMMKLEKTFVLLKLLDDKRIDPSASNNYAIVWAVRNRNLEFMKKLLQDKRVDPTARNNMAIQEACKYGFADVVDRLLQDDRVDPNADTAVHLQKKNVEDLPREMSQLAMFQNNCLEVACQRGHLDVVDRLLNDKRIDPSSSRCRSLYIARDRGYSQIVERLQNDARVQKSITRKKSL